MDPTKRVDPTKRKAPSVRRRTCQTPLAQRPLPFSALYTTALRRKQAVSQEFFVETEATLGCLCHVQFREEQPLARPLTHSRGATRARLGRCPPAGAGGTNRSSFPCFWLQKPACSSSPAPSGVSYEGQMAAGDTWGRKSHRGSSRPQMATACWEGQMQRSLELSPDVSLWAPGTSCKGPFAGQDPRGRAVSALCRRWYTSRALNMCWPQRPAQAPPSAGRRWAGRGLRPSSCTRWGPCGLTSDGWASARASCGPRWEEAMPPLDPHSKLIRSPTPWLGPSLS